MDGGRRSDEGVALVVVVMAMVLMSALGAALIFLTSSEMLIASAYRSSVQALYAADAMAWHAIDELDALADWDAALNGLVRSPFVDGSDRTRSAGNGVVLDLTQVVNMANCGKASCSSADLVENATGDRAWGADNPVWQLWAYGPLSAMLPGGSVSPFYVVAMIARDPAAHSGDPLATLLVRTEAFGPRNSHKVIELTVARRLTEQDRRVPQEGQGGQEGQRGRHLRVISWREMR